MIAKHAEHTDCNESVIELDESEMAQVAGGLNCCSGIHFQEARLVFRKAGDPSPAN
jgi:hypothetical protein